MARSVAASDTTSSIPEGEGCGECECEYVCVLSVSDAQIGCVLCGDCTAQAPCTLFRSCGNTAVGDDPQVQPSSQPDLFHEPNDLQDKDVLTQVIPHL